MSDDHVKVPRDRYGSFVVLESELLTAKQLTPGDNG
jgi:hypothetical protein